MTYTASLDGSTATITMTSSNSTANLKVQIATNLGNELWALVNDASTGSVDNTPAYMVYPTNVGVRVKNILGEIEIPWRSIISIAGQLRA